MARESLVGQSLSGYALERLVGEGGTSTVYQGQHPVHGVVAVKVLRDKLRGDRTAVERFLREARYGERVHHPNVVRTLEIGEARPGLHFLATEWADGQLLERYARDHAPLPPDEVADIVTQIADAVHAAHAVGIVHRDLKPDNVMYDPTTRRVKLLDFGIAVDADIDPAQRLTRAGFFVGTLMYVAPEALSGEIVGPAADQYSLATIAYYLLTGCHPYRGTSPRELFTQLLSQPPTPLNSAREGCHLGGRAEGVVMRALAKDPAKRYPDVLDFARELRAALSERGVEEGEGAAPDGDEGLLAKVRSILRRNRE